MKSDRVNEYTAELPTAYELIVVNQVDCLREHAAQLAGQGAAEGAVIWAMDQRRPSARLNKTWLCNPGDLHCSLILRPDFEAEKFYQMLPVAVISLGHSIAGYLSPMTAMGYQWPNDVCLAGFKAASIWLDKSQASASAWLTITLSANVSHSPKNLSNQSISVREAQGTTDLTSQALLEAFCREFIKQINNWSERGFGYIFEQWIRRLQQTQGRVELPTRMKTYSGIVTGVNPSGHLELFDEDSVVQIVSVDEYMELDG